MSAFLKRIRRLAEEAGEKKVLRWMDERGREEQILTSREVWIRSGAVADKILQHVNAGDRVMIVYPFGLEFVIGLVACMRAGVIAVSVYPPNPGNFSKDIAKFNKYYEDCGATIALTTSRYSLLAKTYSATNLFGGGTSWPKAMQWLATDFSASNSRRVLDAEPKPSDIAFIQYTSGSTGDPKGVMVSFGALDANLDATKAVLGIEQHTTTGVLWLPQYHDLGLVGGFLCTLYEGCTTYFFSPLHFIQNPLLWAELIERHGATNIAAPTFAYGLLAKRVRQSGRSFDLSSLRSAIISAEPIRASVLHDMRVLGIPRAAIDQAYGAAESVAFILSGGQGLEAGWPSCGLLSQSAKFGKRAIVVDEELLRVQPDGVVGHVLITGPDLASGYWNKPDLNRQVFNLQVPGEQGAWYQTGDLGFIKGDQLYLTGRKKDVIIIKGQNFYPQDVEWAAEELCAGQLRPGCVAAGQYDEAAAFVCGEQVPGAPPWTEGDAAKLARGVYRESGVLVKKVVILRKNALPKTTSGKIRRAATGEAVRGCTFEPGDLVLEWTASDDEAAVVEHPSIAIVGAGPAGMVAAYALVKRGYKKIQVLERAECVGGRSVGHDGYDEIYIGSGGYKAISMLAAEFDVDYPYNVPGNSSIPPPVAMPESDAAPERSLNDNMVLELWAKAGYGLATEETPLHYTFGPFNQLYPSNGGVAMHFYQFPPNFFRKLWGAMQVWLEEQGVVFRLGHEVKEVDGSWVDGEHFDKLIMSVMPREAWQLTQEPSLMEVRTNRYGMAVFEATGLDQERYTFIAPHHDPWSVGQPLEMYKKSGVWYSLVYSRLADSPHVAPVSEEKIRAAIEQQVARLGGKVTAMLAVKLWDFFPHPSSKEVNGGFYQRWEEEMQGRRGVYWTGAFLGFDLTETVARHAQEMVARHFPSQLERDAAADIFTPLSVSASEPWYALLGSEVYPAYPDGPTALFPRYYGFQGREGVYKSALTFFDVVGTVEVEPDRRIPAELLQGFFGERQRAAATVRFSDMTVKPDFWPLKRGPTMQILVGGNSFNTTGGLHSIFPANSKVLYHISKSQIDGEDRSKELMAPQLPYLSKEETAVSEFSNMFVSTFHGAGGGDVYTTDTYAVTLHFVPRRAYAPRRRQGDYFADSEAILAEVGLEFDIMVQYRPWRECDFMVERDTLDTIKFAAAGKWDRTKFPLRKLGVLRVPAQEPVDHDATKAWGWRLGGTCEGFGWENAFLPNGFDCFFRHLTFLSTAEFEKLSDGTVDVRNTLLAKVRQMVGGAAVDEAQSPLQLGLNSFQLVQLAKYVQSTYRADFPVTLFFDLATLADVIEYIRAQTTGATYTPQHLVKHCSLRAGKQVDFRKPDLWCFPPIIGSGVYRALSKHLPPDFELCELMDLSLYSDNLEAETIQTLAQRYAAAIRRLQPTGPYCLGGFSFGSILCHAVSHELVDVSSLIMLDGIAPIAKATVIKKFTDSAKVNHFIHKQIGRGLSYRAGQSPAKEVVLVVAEDQSFYEGTEVPNRETLGWVNVEPRVIPHFVPGSHTTIMREPGVFRVAEIVQLHARPPPPSPRTPVLATADSACVFGRRLSSIHAKPSSTPRNDLPSPGAWRTSSSSSSSSDGGASPSLLASLLRSGGGAGGHGGRPRVGSEGTGSGLDTPSRRYTQMQFSRQRLGSVLEAQQPPEAAPAAEAAPGGGWSSSLLAAAVAVAAVVALRSHVPRNITWATPRE